MNESLLFLIPLLPLCCAVINMVFGMRLPRLFAEVLAVTGVAGSFVLTLLFWGAVRTRPGPCSINRMSY